MPGVLAPPTNRYSFFVQFDVRECGFHLFLALGIDGSSLLNRPSLGFLLMGTPVLLARTHRSMPYRPPVAGCLLRARRRTDRGVRSIRT